MAEHFILQILAESVVSLHSVVIITEYFRGLTLRTKNTGVLEEFAYFKTQDFLYLQIFMS